jgi:hypothetical protein
VPRVICPFGSASNAETDSNQDNDQRIRNNPL